MKNGMKRICSLVLALVLVLGMVPCTAQAEENAAQSVAADVTQITGVSVTVDGITYTEGTVPITADTQSILYAVSGTNFAGLSGQCSVNCYSTYKLPVHTSDWTVDTENNTATIDLSKQIFQLITCDNFEISYSNDDQKTWSGSGIYLNWTYDPNGASYSLSAANVVPVSGVTDPNCSVTLDKTTAVAGERVSATINYTAGDPIPWIRTADTATAIRSVKTFSTNTTQVLVFAMPEADVLINVYGYYGINIDPSITNGTAATYFELAYPGSSQTVTVTPDEGYRYVAGSLKVTNDLTGEEVEVDESNMSFTMPAAPVTITAQFEQDPAANAAASVTINGSTSYYATMNEAIEAVKDCTADDNAVVKMEQDVDLGSEYLQILSGVFTFDLNGKTLSSSKYGWGALCIDGGNVTITDSGEGGAITHSTFYGVMAWYGCTVTIEGGTITGYHVGVDCNGSTVVINGGTIIGENEFGVQANASSTVTINGGTITGSKYDLYIWDSTVSLGLGEDGVGAAFPDGLDMLDDDGFYNQKTDGLTLKDILGEGAAYWQGDKMLTNVTGTSIDGGVTVKAACKHENVAYPAEFITDTQHKIVCSCGYEVTREHSTTAEGDRPATCTTKAYCSVCESEYGEAGSAHSEMDSDGKCVSCRTALVASLTRNGTTLYYANADDAFAAGNAAGSGTVTILADANVTVQTTLKVPLVIEEGVTLTLKQYTYCEGDIVNHGIITGLYLKIIGDYQGGTVYSSIYLLGRILSGTFTGPVRNEMGTIAGGTFTGSIDNITAMCKIEGGVFEGTVNNGLGTVSGGTFNGELANPRSYDVDISDYVFGTVYADNITLGSGFTYDGEIGTAICNTHKHTDFNTPATCQSGAICYFCGTAYTDPNTSDHSLAYTKSTEGAIIVEYCTETGCTHNETAEIGYIEDNSGEYVYTGYPIEPCEVKYSDGWMGGELTIIYSYNTDASHTHPTAAIEKDGEYQAICFAIVPAEPTADHFTFTAPENLTYDRNAKEATVELKEPYTGCDFTVYYLYDMDWSTIAPRTAGTYDVKIEVASTSKNFTSVIGGVRAESWKLTIGKANALKTAPVAIENLVFTGAAQALIVAGEATDIAIAENYTMQYSVNGGEYSSTVPTAVEAGTYVINWRVGENAANLVGASGTIEVTVAKKDITYTAPTAKDLTYNGAAQALVSGGTADYGTFEYKLGDGAWSADVPNATDAGDYTVWYRIVDQTGNYNSVDPASLTVTVKPLTLVAEDLTGTMDPLVWTGEELTVTFTELKMNGLDVTCDLTDNKATNVGVHTMTVTGKGNFAGSVQLSFYIAPDADVLDDITTGNVTSADADTIAKAEKMVETADTSKLDPATKAETDAALRDIADQAAALEEQLEKAADAVDADTVTKAESITAENVELEDKEDLRSAKDDLEKALTDYGTNYTEDEKAEIRAEIDRIEDLLSDIADAEAVIDQVQELPTEVQTDDAGDWDAVEKAKEAYDKLSAVEKELVDSAIDGLLDERIAKVTDVGLIKISDTKWYRGSKKDITVTYDGPYGRFSHLTVNGKTLDSAHYSVKEGSTVITLKSSYLESLATDKSYDVVAYYSFGDQQIASETATFTAYKAGSNPATGDVFNAGLWAGVGGVSIVALIVLLIVLKKKK